MRSSCWPLCGKTWPSSKSDLARSICRRMSTPASRPRLVCSKGENPVTELALIMEGIRQELTTKNQVRDNTLNRSRELIRFCALSIRAIHRHEWDEAADGLKTARDAAQVMVNDLAGQPDLYFTGYTQDALKELVEAHTLFAFVRGGDVPGPAELRVPAAAYLNGLAEAASELRRFILDLIRRGETATCEPYLSVMDDVYARL